MHSEMPALEKAEQKQGLLEGRNQEHKDRIESPLKSGKNNSQPVEGEQDFTLLDLFELEEIQEIQDTIAQATGVASLITHTDGTPITKPSNFCSLCRDIIRKNELGLANCIQSDSIIGSTFNPYGPTIQPCHSAGLQNAGVSIRVGDKHIANWLIGQVRSDSQTEEQVLRYAREIGANEKAFLLAWAEIPFMSEEQFEQISRVLFLMANQLSEIASQNVHQARYISELKQTEKAIRNSEAQFRGLVEHLRVGILIIKNGMIVYQNPEQRHLFEGLPDAFQLQDITRLIHPDDQSLFWQLMDSLETSDQRLSDVILRLKRHPDDEESAELRWIGCRKGSLEYQGEEACLITMADITRIKYLEHLIMLREKMASLGHVAAGIAHEIRNPLSGINVYLDAIQDSYQDHECTDDIPELIREAQRASNKIENVIKRVLDFSRPCELKLKPGCVNEAIHEAVKLAAASLRKSSIALQLDLAQDLPEVFVDMQFIEQVILNLITNAADVLKTVRSDRRIRISTCSDQVIVLIRVEDNGPGIPPDLWNRIFEPFFTTRNQGMGIGVGICQRIITDHGGTIDVTLSSLGGAQFNVAIPIEKRRVDR